MTSYLMAIVTLAIPITICKIIAIKIYMTFDLDLSKGTRSNINMTIESYYVQFLYGVDGSFASSLVFFPSISRSNLWI